MKKNEFYITSATGLDQLYCIARMPQEKPDAILVMVHGMVEHIGRYEHMAEYLCQNGIGFVGYDQLGHGKTAVNQAQLGYFAASRGDKIMIKDMEHVIRYVRKKNPGIPVVLCGHSMGSFLVRRFITLYGRSIRGCILIGTGHYSRKLTWAGRRLAGGLALTKGEFYRSPLMQSLVLEGYSRPFEKSEHKSWLTTDEEMVQKHADDPQCHFLFTASAYRDFFRILGDLAKKKQFHNIPPRLPIYLISGKDDPVGNFGKGVKTVYRELLKSGVKNVEAALYPGKRHEIMNETNRDEVFEDVVQWIRESVTKQ